MNLGSAVGTSALTALFTALDSGAFTFYTGAPPASVGTALSGNTSLGAATFAATALSGSISASGDNVTGSLAFTSPNFTTTGAGTITFARAENSGATAGVIDLGVSSIWLPSTAVVLHQMATNGGNLYIVTTAGTTASSGGPTTTASSITDGTAVWSYVKPGTASVTISNAAVTGNVPVTIQSATISLPITNPVGSALVV